MVLLMSALVLAGCGRRENSDRKAISEIVVFQMDTQTTQKPEMTPVQDKSASKAELNSTADIAAPTATPYTVDQKTSEEQTADIDRLMDDLEETLNELDASTTAADQDTLTDSALIALGK